MYLYLYEFLYVEQHLLKNQEASVLKLFFQNAKLSRNTVYKKLSLKSPMLLKEV